MSVRTAWIASVLAGVVACGPVASPAATSAGAQAASVSPRALKTITISLPSTSATSAALQIAEREGFFAKHGLMVEFTLHAGGPPALQALVADASQATVQITGTVVTASANGADVVIVAGSQADPDYQLYARPDITSTAQLRGKRFASADPGSEYNTILKKTLAQYGIPGDGYDPVNVGASGARLAALVAGAADATLLSAPQSFEAEAKGMRRLGSSLDAIPNYMFTIIAVRREWAKANRDLLVELIRADQEALAWMDQPANREKLIDHWVDITKASRESAAKTYDLYIAGPLKGKVFPKDAQVSRSGVEAVIAITKEGGSLKKDVTVDQIVDFSFLDAAGKK